MFLKELYRRWKFLFFLVIAWMLGQAFFMYKGVETIPFFLYNMYSVPYPANDTTYTTSIYINGSFFDESRLSAHEKEMLTGSFSWYLRLRENNFNATDPTAIHHRLENKLPEAVFQKAYQRLTNEAIRDTAYLNWFGRYLSRVSQQSIDSFSIVRSRVAWTPCFHKLNDTALLITYVTHR